MLQRCPVFMMAVTSCVIFQNTSHAFFRKDDENNKTIQPTENKTRSEKKHEERIDRLRAF